MTSTHRQVKDDDLITDHRLLLLFWQRKLKNEKSISLALKKTSREDIVKKKFTFFLKSCEIAVYSIFVRRCM
jgi:hypothetical protein